MKSSLAWMLAAACALPAAASAQFFFAIGGTLDPPNCTNTGAGGTASAVISFSLPSGNPNGGVTLRVNGAIVEEGTFFQPTLSGTQSVPVYTLSIPSTPFPYTIVAEQFPIAHGEPTGTGLRITVTCAAAGTGTVAIGSVFFGRESVPTLADAMLVVLSALLAWAAALRIRRRRA